MSKDKVNALIHDFDMDALMRGATVQLYPKDNDIWVLLSPSAQEWIKKKKVEDPIPMLLWCPLCHMRHVDKGEFSTKPHHTHACQNCGHVWRPAIVHTVGVQFLPGFKDAKP